MVSKVMAFVLLLQERFGAKFNGDCSIVSSYGGKNFSKLLATLPAPLSLDPLILTSKHHEHQPYTCHAHVGSALNLLP